jgi:hypothetical protein
MTQRVSADLESRQEWYADYYAEADCVNLNHSNSPRGNFYIRKGAVKCRAKMLAVALSRATQARRESEWATDRAVRMEKIVSDLEAGRALEEIYL